MNSFEKAHDTKRLSSMNHQINHLNPRRYGVINWYGMWTLYKREVMRFMNVWIQTLLAPVITGILFLSVFHLALNRAVIDVNGVPFTQFIATGIISMGILQQSFANTSSSLGVAKMQGNLSDLFMVPLSARELLLAFTLGGITRGAMVGLVNYVAFYPILNIPISFLGYVLVFTLLGAGFMSLAGIIAGIWAEKWDQMAVVTNFVITPLAFLSGTFYSIERLPDAFRMFTSWNPFFHMIDGFRYGVLGVTDFNAHISATFLLSVCILMWLIAHRMLKTGYKTKS